MPNFYTELSSDIGPEVWESKEVAEQTTGIKYYTEEEYVAAFPSLKPELPSLVEQTQILMDCIQAHLDNFARTRSYDSVISAVSYTTSANATYRVEGQYMSDARDAIWEWANNYLNQVLTGRLPIPSWAEFESTLNTAVPLAWPVPDTRVTCMQA